MENKRLGCVNRDWNSVKNMKYIVDYWFEHKERPQIFQRGYDLTSKESIKVSNHLSNGDMPDNNTASV
jgi:hypothetical protein